MNILEDAEFLDFVATQESQNLVDASSLAELTKQSFSTDDDNVGLKMPWPALADKFAFRGGEITIWAGINGHGKSQVLNQVCALTSPATIWLIASLEMPLKRTMNRMVRQMSGVEAPSDGYIDQLVSQTKGHIWLYDQIDTVPSDRIIAMIHYAATKYGVKHVIIDSLVKCGIGVDDYNGQKMFVDRLAWAAKRYDIHIHIVHHIRKSEREGKIPDKFDVKGAGEIVDLTDNLIIFHRNKDKERRVQKGEEVGEGEPDNMLIVAKQRHGTGWEGRLPLYHHPQSLQYLSAPTARPFQMGAV